MIAKGKSRDSYSLINREIQTKKRNYQNSGTINVIKCEVEKQPSVLDFIQGGCEMNLVVAIDFTASNGDPKLATSLHYRNPLSPNEYIKAIKAIGEVLSQYDSDQRFPCFGFGASVNRVVSHCFPLNGNEANPEVHGVQGVLDAYADILNKVTLQGPTNFAQIIRKAASYATQCSQQDQRYVILLIITDGEISDMNATVNEIVAASVLPLSIVIVGVGNANFQKMDILDADDEPLISSNGKKMARDIVQFVPFRDFRNAHYSKIAEVTLQEIPDQVLGYFKSMRITPNPRQYAQDPRSMGYPGPHQSMYPPGSFINQPGPGAPVPNNMYPPGSFRNQPAPGDGANPYQQPALFPSASGPDPTMYPPGSFKNQPGGPADGGNSFYQQPALFPSAAPVQPVAQPPGQWFIDTKTNTPFFVPSNAPYMAPSTGGYPPIIPQAMAPGQDPSHSTVAYVQPIQAVMPSVMYAQPIQGQPGQPGQQVLYAPIPGQPAYAHPGQPGQPAPQVLYTQQGQPGQPIYNQPGQQVQGPPGQTPPLQTQSSQPGLLPQSSAANGPQSQPGQQGQPQPK